MYILPQVLVHQEFTQAITVNENPLFACIIGPRYQLNRYAVEKTALGAYNVLNDTPYAWPGREAGAVVDQDWVKLFFEQAWLKYWTNPDQMHVVSASERNKVRATTTNFQSYKSWARSAELYDRDVQVGDGVKVSGVGADSNYYELETYVTGFEHEEVAASIGAAAPDVDNQASTAAAASVSQTGGTVNGLTATADGSAYDGLVEGRVEETYTIEVIQGSNNGDATTARLRITSLSGTDNQASVTPAAFGSATAIGTRGLKITFDNPSSGSSSSSAGGGIPSGPDFVVGQVWTAQVSQQYSEVVASSGGTYTGEADAKYIVTVTRGGSFADQPQIQVTTDTGYDVSGPHVVTGAGVPVQVGNYGVTISFDGPLVKGDRFYIDVVAAGDGAVRTLVLAHTVPEQLLSQELTVDLFIIKDMQVSRNRVGHPPLTNFDTSETEITVKAGILGTDDSWTNGGTPMEMPVLKADMYLEYRALLTAGANTVGSTSDISDVEDDLGVISPDNPLAYGVYKALQNAGGVAVKWVAVESNDLEGYTKAIGMLVGRNDIYSLVPLTKDPAIHGMVHGHVMELSSAENARWRRAYFNGSVDEEMAIVDEALAGGMVKATIQDDPATSGVQYTLVTWDEGKFLTLGVTPGDVVRCNYQNDAFGNYTYDSYVVDQVISEDTLRLISGPAAAVNVPSKIEVWRNLTTDDMASAYVAKAKVFNTRRITYIWPDEIDADDGNTVDGYFLCAAYAGLRSSSAPHRPLTNASVAGFLAAPRSTDFFDGDNLNYMAGNGVCIITQAPTGEIYCRHQVTTGEYEDVNEREESICTNADSISYYMMQTFSPYIGRVNITDDLVNFMDSQLQAALETLKANDVEGLGPQLLAEGTEIKEFRRHTIFKDRLVARATLGMPYPYNNLDLYLVI